MSKYSYEIRFESGYVSKCKGETTGDREDFDQTFSEDILEGFYPNDIAFGKSFHEQIKGIKFYWKGIRRKESPVFWENGIGYIFSENGIERVVLPNSDQKLPDFHTAAQTQKLDRAIAGLDMHKIGEIMNNLEKGEITPEEADTMLRRYGSGGLEWGAYSSPSKEIIPNRLEQKTDNFSLEYGEAEKMLEEHKELTNRDIFSLGYNDFLSSILTPNGLDHGYDLFVEGTYLRHRIFTKESMRKNSLLGRIFIPRLWGQRYLVHTVGRFDEEPWFNASEGCISDKVARIGVIDGKYEKELKNVLANIMTYSDNVKEGIKHTDKKDPIILSFS